MMGAMHLVKAGLVPTTIAALLLAALAACGSVNPQNPDAGPDGPPPDAVPACVPRVLLTGGMDVAAQGWTPSTQQPFTLTYDADTTRLQTTTSTGALTGGQLLLSYPDVVEADKPFAIQIEMQVESASAHNASDASVAIMGSFTPAFGSPDERGKMIYIEPNRVGFADDSASVAKNLVDGAYHTYVLSRDAGGVLRLTIDGTETLTRAAYTSNGRIAIGDQTNDPNVDAVMRVRKITKLCP